MRKLGIVFVLVFLCFFVFSNYSYAVGYGSGLYGSGLYSLDGDVTPSTNVSVSTATPIPTSTPNLTPILAPQQPISPAVSPIPTKPLYSFTRDLEAGSEGKDVQALQDLLINKGYLASDKNTGYFGPLTRNALIQYQKANNIIPASGYFGPKTKSSFKSVTAVVPNQTIIPATIKSILTKTFTKGMQDPEIVILQNILKNIPGIYPQGITSGYFGDLTLQAVKKFQIQYSIVSSPSETGYGVVGPKTRAKLNEM